MKTVLKNIAVITSLAVLAAFGSFAWAGEGKPTQTIAMILSDLNHYPSDEEKEKLAMISKDESTSEATQTLAKTLHDLQHKPSAEDKEALAAIVESEEASDAEKQLAKIIMDINHKPSAEAQAKLEEMM